MFSIPTNYFLKCVIPNDETKLYFLVNKLFQQTRQKSQITQILNQRKTQQTNNTNYFMTNPF